MAKRQLVNVTGAAFTSITASQVDTYVEIAEDGSGSAAGLIVQFPDDNFTVSYEYPPSAQPIKIGAQPTSGHTGRARVVGVPSQNTPVPNAAGGYVATTSPATILAKVKSMGANTVVRVEERP